VTKICELGTTHAAKKYQVAHLVFLRKVRRLLVTASVVPSSPIFVTLKMQAPSSSEISVLTRATRRNFPEGAILDRYYFRFQVAINLLVYVQYFFNVISTECGPNLEDKR
jgi:hypothetical protein